MINVVCVRVGEKYGRDYVAILHDMVKRNLDAEHRFWCLTDDPQPIHEEIGLIETTPDLPGWWQKLALFAPDMPWKDERVVYLDLDVAVVGRLDELVETRGIIRDWHLPGYNSSVMVWDGGEHSAIWSLFAKVLIDELPGDQDWITSVDQLQDGDCMEGATRVQKWEILPRDWCLSYRSHAAEFPPVGAKVVCFHGEPKPHEAGGWVGDVWKIGGLTELPALTNMNVSFAHALDNVQVNSERDIPWFVGSEPHDDVLVIVGGAPSLRDNIEAIRNRKRRGAKVMALNNACAFLNANAIFPDSLMVCDARPENVVFVRATAKRYLLASQCDPALFEEVENQDTHLIHLAICDEMRDLMAPYEETKPIILVGGGSTVGLRAINVAILSGYRKVHIYGMDSSFEDSKHHAYEQRQNDTDNATEVYVPALEKHYVVAPWMARQAAEFRDIAWPTAAANGVRLHVHGRGLIPDMARHLAGHR